MAKNNKAKKKATKAKEKVDRRQFNKGNPKAITEARKHLKQGRILNAKQKAFAEYYLQTNNATESARRAGYANKSAGSIGAENLKKPHILAYIKERLDKMEEERMMKSDEVIKNLTRIGRREEVEHVVVTVVEKRDEWVEVGGTWRKISVENTVPKIVEIPARLGDTNKALELLGKSHRLFTDKIEQEVDMDLRVVVDYGDSEESEDEE